LCWDVSVICPLVESYVDGAAIEAGVAAELAASRKEATYADLESRCIFEPTAVKTHSRCFQLLSLPPFKRHWHKNLC